MEDGHDPEHRAFISFAPQALLVFCLLVLPHLLVAASSSAGRSPVMDNTNDIPSFVEGYEAANRGEGFVLVPMKSPAWCDGYLFPIRWSEQ